jgi:glycosyltransferase involved in cell wall biosynthesis
MGSRELGGLGEIPNPDLPAFTARYRFFFNPIRYTSMGLSVCEALMAGLPVVGLATTEMAVNIPNDVAGYVHTDVDFLIRQMRRLLEDRVLANRLSVGAREAALRQFNIERFKQDWLDTLDRAVGQTAAADRPAAASLHL